MARKRQPTHSTPKPINRRILFYRLVMTPTVLQQNPQPQDLSQILNYISQLEYDRFAPLTRYLVEGTGETVLSVGEIRADVSPFRLRLCRTRHENLPLVEDRGQFSPPNLGPTGGLGEVIHVVIFPDGIVGAEFNFHGPRIARLPPYLLAKAPHLCPPLSFQMLLRREAMAKLQQMKKLNFFHLKIRASYLEQVEEAGLDLGHAFDAATKAGDDGEIEITMAAKAKRSSLGGNLLEFLNRLIQRDDYDTNVLEAEARGITEEEDAARMDLMSRHFQISQTFIPLSVESREIVPAIMFGAIESAYVSLKSELQRAAGVEI